MINSWFIKYVIDQVRENGSQSAPSNPLSYLDWTMWTTDKRLRLGAGSMPGQRRRRWPSIEPASSQLLLRGIDVRFGFDQDPERSSQIACVGSVPNWSGFGCDVRETGRPFDWAGFRDHSSVVVREIPVSAQYTPPEEIPVSKVTGRHNTPHPGDVC